MTPLELSTSRPEDPLETSLVELGPQLVSLTPFKEGEEEVIRPTSMGAARVLSQMISIEGDVPKPRKIIAGKEPRAAGPKSAGPKSAGPMPTGSKTAGGRPPRPTVGGKAPRKQVVPQKKKIKTRVQLVELRSLKQRFPRGTSGGRHFASYKQNHKKIQTWMPSSTRDPPLSKTYQPSDTKITISTTH